MIPAHCFGVKTPEDCSIASSSTEPGDLVLDIFAGSNTTGEAAEDNKRRWISYEIKREYVAATTLLSTMQIQQ